MIEATKHGCRNVLKLEQAIEDRKSLILITPIFNSGNLVEFLERYPDFNSEWVMKKVIHDVALGLSDLHKLGIIHRDIKPQNILIQQEAQLWQRMPTSFRAVIADLGIATKLTAARTTTSWRVGTDGFIAPEVFQSHPYSYSCDLFSLGSVGYWICSGQLPFYSEKPKLYYHKLSHEQLDLESHSKLSRLSGPCKNILQRMLERDVNKRITIDELLQHHWFNSKS